jgi:hypothetical protein
MQTETISNEDSFGITSTGARLILSTDSNRVLMIRPNGTMYEFITDNWVPIDPSSIYFVWKGAAAMKVLREYGKWVYTKFKSNLPEFVQLKTTGNKNKVQ